MVIFGGIHLEMGALKLLGWTGTLTQAGIASSGTADSFLKALHVTHTRRLIKLLLVDCICF